MSCSTNNQGLYSLSERTSYHKISSRELSKPWDSASDFSKRSEIWQAAQQQHCQISSDTIIINPNKPIKTSVRFVNKVPVFETLGEIGEVADILHVHFLEWKGMKLNFRVSKVQ